jgi:hypothetical protein
MESEMNNHTSQLNSRIYVVSYSIFIFLNLSFSIFSVLTVLRELLGLGTSSDPHGYGCIVIGVLISLINFIICSVVLIMLVFRKNKNILRITLLTFINSFALLAGYFFIFYNVLVIWIIVIDIIRERRILKEEPEKKGD